MNQYLWEKFSNEDINDRIKYWADKWIDICNKLDGKSIEKSDYYFTHLTLLELRKVILENEFSKKELIVLYIERLGICQKEDPVINASFKHEFNNIISQLEKRQDPIFFVQSLNYLIEKFEYGIYFELCLTQIIDVLLEEEDNNSHELIKKLSIAIIGEFFIREFSVNTIKKIPQIIFSKYDSNDRIHASSTLFPHDIKWEDDDNQESYSKKVMDYLDNLSIRGRIIKISDIFNKDLQEGHFIFNINGFYGDGELKLENVHLYSPRIFQYIQDETRKIEFFGKEGENIVNAAINLKFRDVEYSKEIAINELNKAFDLIRAFSSTSIPFEVYPYDYIVVNNGVMIHWNHKFGPKHELFINKESLKFSDLSYSSFTDKINSLLIVTDTQKLSHDREDSVTKIQSSALFFRNVFAHSNLTHKAHWILTYP